MTSELGLIFFISAFVILVAGVFLVISKRASRRYMIYRIVPLAGFFGAFGLAKMSDPSGSTLIHAGIAFFQTISVMLLLHFAIGRRLKS